MKIRIYTDGACSGNPGAGGWAAVFSSQKECYYIKGGEEETTNNRMELKAVIEAFKKVIHDANDGIVSDYELYSDSAYVVNSINKGWLERWQKNNWVTSTRKEVKNRDLWESFICLAKQARFLNCEVEVKKIKGHSGNTFNELVDKLAKDSIPKIQ